ncbi:hypothetical protein TcCL_ESM08052 [Trypanosoma cruzi]|nr:hypothetical protein TcCL_ESM08052 [Trypanosoma cruzi]
MKTLLVEMIRGPMTTPTAVPQQLQLWGLTLARKKLCPPIIRANPPLKAPDNPEVLPIVRLHQPTNMIQSLRMQDPQQRQPQTPQRVTRRRKATVTAAPRFPTPPPLFCFFLLLRVRLRLRWWPRESE